ncbi:hypothetical protein [Yinghuangia seranimata]|uniref:hypothetical protein n=1 Tax=Yinghuangia seranimata TaxID=408067 RepID=UPI00248B90F1|nr:hypothetical protein [Yinghuangia seranimata]MDI2127960.1 hypothetical protein [Yinghuangia seranimata]
MSNVQPPPARCPAAHADDPDPCEGLVIVRILDQFGGDASACVHHGARLYASLIRPRVYPLPGCDGRAIEVYNRAQHTEPFAWTRDERGRA